jgi:hypothetical protein
MRKLDLKQMMVMQEELNDVYAPGWLENKTQADYLTQIVDESSELLRSGFEYKWWSNVPLSDLNMWNASIEIIDMLFFYMSMARFDLTASDVQSLEGVYASEVYPRLVGISDNKMNRSVFIELLSPMFFQHACGTSVEDFVSTVGQLLGSVGLDAQTASAVYSAKYTLNLFRISSGYKQGLYTKVRDGIEDNQRLQALVLDFVNTPSMTLDTLMANVSNSFFKPVIGG